jgi:hypothetical protein
LNHRVTEADYIIFKKTGVLLRLLIFQTKLTQDLDAMLNFFEYDGIE